MIQEMIDAAKAGDTVKIPAGTYNIDLIHGPEKAGIILKSGITLDLTDATLKANPTSELGYRILKVWDCDDVTIIGGKIIGDRDIHLGSTEWSVGGFGHGICLRRANRIRIHRTHVSRCFADGIYIDGDSSDVVVSNVVSDGNRRQGLSAIWVNNLLVTNCTFSNTGGTPPGDGIDLECDSPHQHIKNVLIDRCKFFNNEGSCVGVNGSPGTYQNIRITNCSFDMKSQPIWVAGGLNLGTPWWAMVLNRLLEFTPTYRWWGYPTTWAI